MKKIIFIIIGLLLFILTQCNWYVQYQHSYDVLFEDLPQIVQDSIISIHSRFYYKLYPRPEIISVDDKYFFKTKYIPWSPAGGSWVDYYYIENKKDKKIHKIQYNIPTPCITYKDSLYICTEYNWFGYENIDKKNLIFKRYNL